MPVTTAARACSRSSACSTSRARSLRLAHRPDRPADAARRYYALRGLSLLVLPLLFAPHVHPSMLLFIVFYGLDWVATVPPTMALCREHFGARAPVVFGWVFASHQVGAAAWPLGAGIIRDQLDTYDLAWYVAGALCLVAGVLSLAVGRARAAGAVGAGVPRDLQQGGAAATGAPECRPCCRPGGSRACPGSVPRVEPLAILAKLGVDHPARSRAGSRR